LEDFKHAIDWSNEFVHSTLWISYAWTVCAAVTLAALALNRDRCREASKGI